MTWNIRTGIGNDPHRPDVRAAVDLERIARTVQAIDPDVLALQEVDCNRQRTDYVDQAALLASLLGMHYRYGPNLVDEEGEYGVAILTKHPILSGRHDRFPTVDGWEPRGIVEVIVDVPELGRVSVLNTHLQVAFGEGEEEASRQRRESVAIIAERILQSPYPVVLTGDFNSEPGVEDLDGLSVLSDAWTIAGGDNPGPTFPATPFGEPEIRIDAIFTDQRLKADSCRIIRTPDTALASDHYPLVAELALID